VHTSGFEVGTGDTASQEKQKPTTQCKNTSECTNFNSIICGHYP